MQEACEHDWVEDEMFASGVVMMFGGSVDDVGEETKVVCRIGTDKLR